MLARNPYATLARLQWELARGLFWVDRLRELALKDVHGIFMVFFGMSLARVHRGQPCPYSLTCWWEQKQATPFCMAIARSQRNQEVAEDEDEVEPDVEEEESEPFPSS